MSEPRIEGPEELCEACHQLYQSGLIYSAGGNVSVRVKDFVYITPTGGALGKMQPADLVKVSMDGVVLSDGVPSKELGMHLALLHAREGARAIVHPHPPAIIAHTVRYPTPRLNAFPPTNAGFYVRAGQVPLIPYFPSGSQPLHDAITYLAPAFHVIALGHHGIVAAGRTLLEAINVIEEVEYNCKILHMAGESAHYLSEKQCSDVDAARGRVWPDASDYADWFKTLPTS